MRAQRSISPAAGATALVVAGWGSLYVFLLATDRTFLYLSPRTAWLVPVGACILAIAFFGRVAYVRHERALGARETFGLALVALPVVIVLALPPASLSSFAAGRRSSFASAAFVTNVEDITTGDLSLADIAGAVRSDEAMAALAARAGAEVEFIGFVARERGMPTDEFHLTRFLISCCVADALSVQVRVAGAPPGRFRNDDWVRVRGNLYPLDDEVIIDATDVVAVEKPKRPYLNP